MCLRRPQPSANPLQSAAGSSQFKPAADYNGVADSPPTATPPLLRYTPMPVLRSSNWQRIIAE